MGCGGEGRPVASVVVAVRGSVPALAGLVAAVADQDFPLEDVELIVVDNHPVQTVPTTLFAGVQFAHVVVHEPHAGLSRARNAGIRQARGDYIVITDADTRPERSWLRMLVEALEATGAYCVGGRVVPWFTAGERPMLESAVEELFAPALWPDRVIRLGSPFWVVGCNLAARRDPLPRFDERLGAVGRRHRSCEDLEFVARAERNGLDVVVAPNAVADRAIHPADLRWSAIVGRAFWHGVSMARLVSLHPGMEVYDSYRVRDAWQSAREGKPWTAATGLARIAGWRAEQVRRILGVVFREHQERRSARGGGVGYRRVPGRAPAVGGCGSHTGAESAPARDGQSDDVTAV